MDQYLSGPAARIEERVSSVDEIRRAGRELAKDVLARVMPGTAQRLRARGQARLREYQAAFDARVQRILASVSDPVAGPVVGRGPFRGMRYAPEACTFHAICKLVGSCEEELAAVFELFIARGYHTVINVGSAEGYYAIGLAYRMPDARVYAFDIDPTAQALCRAMSVANGVADRVTVRGACTTSDLIELARPGTLIVCDCEGCERDLFPDDVVKALAGVDLVIELHDFIDPTISTTLVRRFGASHAVTLIPTRSRDPSRYPVLRGLPPEDQALAVSELRPSGMEWALCVARS